MSLVNVTGLGRGEKIREVFCTFGCYFLELSLLLIADPAVFQNIKNLMLLYFFLYSRVLLPETSLDIVSPGIGGANSVSKAPEM